MKLPTNLRGFHNSHDGVIPTLLSVIEEQNHEINETRMQLNILKEEVAELKKSIRSLSSGVAAALRVITEEE